MYVLDVRREADYAASNESLPGAHWKNPEHLADWTDSLPQDQAIVLYCVRGGAVSNSVVDALQARGLQARYIDGGIDLYGPLVTGHGGFRGGVEDLVQARSVVQKGFGIDPDVATFTLRGFGR